jgi:hypothetical protein
MVENCKDYILDGTDTCKKCITFFSVTPDGQCQASYIILLYTIIGCFVAGTLFFLTFIGDLCSRPNINDAALQRGNLHRSNMKLHSTEETFEEVPDPKNPGQTKKVSNISRDLYPFDTNLCVTDVAGPGMVLHFRFQVFLVVWAMAVACIWWCFCLRHNDLYILGTRKFGTPRENCILVEWGWHTQHELMWTKVYFLVITYFFTFAVTILHAILQMQCFEKLDAKTKSMKDFAAFVSGLPTTVKGKENMEEKLTTAVNDTWGASEGKKCIGCSVAWNYKDKEEDVELYLEREMCVRDREYYKKHNKTYQYESDQQKKHNETATNYNALRKWFYKQEFENGKDEDETINQNWSVPMEERGEDADKEATEEKADAEMKEAVEEFSCAGDAFIVFNEEEDRDSALEYFEKNALTYKSGDGEEATLTVEMKICEPDTILWQNFGNTSLLLRIRKVCEGFGWILLALFFWTTVFYAPYAWQVATFNYDNGNEPGFVLGMTFCMVVVLGNAIMYEVCARVSDYIGFKTRDERESAYLILYVIACMFNVCLDMATTFFMAALMLDGLGFRSIKGEKLGWDREMGFTELFETYAMQRVLAKNLKAYCFPATFLIPFLLEPFITCIFPFLGGEALVKSHPEWIGRDAEKFMQSFDFDMGRYGDLLLDMLLAILIFYFPGGYTLILFFGMAGSHSYIYFFDHWRVLRVIPKCTYASLEVDWWSNWMMGPITATIMSALIFKNNCKNFVGPAYCLKGWPLIEACSAGWIAHSILQTLVLLFVVPMFKPETEDSNAGEDWQKASRRYACNWFTSNPIFCLRSRLLHGDKPACSFHMDGKEHLHVQNPKIGLHFYCEEGKGEEAFDFKKTMQRFSGKVKKEGEEEKKP